MLDSQMFPSFLRDIAAFLVSSKICSGKIGPTEYIA
jgi:hypothetical protein